MKEIIRTEINQTENTVIKGILSALLSGRLISNGKETSRRKKKSYKYVAYLALFSEILAITSEFCQAQRKNTSRHLLQEAEREWSALWPECRDAVKAASGWIVFALKSRAEETSRPRSITFLHTGWISWWINDGKRWWLMPSCTYNEAFKIHFIREYFYYGWGDCV